MPRPSTARHRRRAALLAAACGALLLAAPVGAHAQSTLATDALRRSAVRGSTLAAREPAPLERLGEIEQRLVERALATRARTPEPFAEGLIVDEILVETVDVITEDDFLPTWLNIFHVTTKPSIIEERLVIAPGDTVTDARLEEVRRHLLDDLIFSTVLVIPVRDDAGKSDHVDLLIVTRDVWSLRLNSNFQATGDTLNFLAFSIAETNFLGLNKHIALSFLIEQDTVAFGPTFVDPAFFGTRLVVDERIKFAINHQNGDFEGASGTVSIGQPLYSLETEWGWAVDVAFRHLIERAYIGSDLRRFPIDAEEGDATLPWVYRNRILDAQTSVTNSVITDPDSIQHNLGYGWRVLVSLPEAMVGRDAPPELAERFRSEAMPRERQDSYPFVRYRTFDPDYREYHDVETLELVEELRLGHELIAAVGVGAPFTGSAEALVAPSLSTSYAATFTGTDYASISAGIGSRLESGQWIDTRVEGALRYTSPLMLGFARLSLGALTEFSLEDSDNAYLTLGGDNGLRGFPSAYFIGTHLVRANAELRTVGLELLSMWWGLAAFYDGGDVFEDTGLTDLRWHHGTGIGLRWLIPQFNRAVIRIDWGLPLDTLSPFPGSPSIAFGQAF